MFFSKRGQSALEYLMTYGWALVVIVIVIAALVFLIQPSQVGGNTCSTTSGILITNHQLDSSADEITVALSNQTATTLTDVLVDINGTIGGVTSNTVTQETVPNLGTVAQTEAFGLTPVFDVGDAYSLNVKFTYQDRDAFTRTVTATCNGTAS